MRIELSPTTMVGNFVVETEDILENAGFVERNGSRFNNTKTYKKIIDTAFIKFEIAMEAINTSDIVVYLLKVPGKKGMENGLYKIWVGGLKPARFIGENINEFADDLQAALDCYVSIDSTSASMIESKSNKLVQSFIKNYL